MNLNLVPWCKVFGEDLAAVTLADSLRGYFNIPSLNFGSTFRIVVSAFAAGSVTGKLRFGILNADAAGSLSGLDFPAVAAIASVLQTVVFDVAAIAPDCKGSPLGTLPPRVAVILTTAALTTLSYELQYSGISVQP